MVDMVSGSFAAVLKEYRAGAGLTQEELAERAGLSARTISDLERGVKHRPYPYTVQRLAQALALTDDERARLLRSGRRPPEMESEEIDAVSPVSRRSSLPVHPTRFIGRRQEVEEIERLLGREDVRLLTLTGPGGVGKTRLALRAVEGVAKRFSAGAVFVSLAPLGDPTLVAPTIAAGLRIKEGRNQGMVETLIEHLREKHLLLVLDNLEHLLPASRVVAQLLASCPQLTILVTSRAVLRLAAEQEYPVPPLPVPVPGHLPELEALLQYDVVQLFLQRAQAATPHFRLKEENASTIAAICSELDGLPLAIELAAARLRFFPPRALLARLSERLQLLNGGPRDAPPRLQTLRNTMEWSYRLLTPDEQALFDRLSVFTGGCTLEAAEAVCLSEPGADLLPGITALLEQSLVQEEGEETPRLLMLETIREYGLERLAAAGSLENVRRRHAEWVLQFTEEAAHEVRGPDQVTWLQRVEAEQNNVRAALAWTRDRREIEIGLRIASALERYYVTHGLLSEGRHWLDELLLLNETQGGAVAAAVRVNALVQASRLARTQGDPEKAATLAEEGIRLARRLGDKQRLALCLAASGFAVLPTDTQRATGLCEEALALHTESGDTQGIAETLGSLGMVAALQGDYQRAAILIEESLALWQHCGDVLNIALAHLKLGDLALVASGNMSRVRHLYERSLDGYRSVGHKSGMGHALAALADLAQDQGDLERAQALAEESLTLLQAHGERHITGWATRILGEVVLSRGHVPQALALLRESLRLARLVGDVDLIAAALEGLAAGACAEARLERAARLYSAAAAIRQAAGIECPPQRKAAGYRACAELREVLGDESFALAWDTGRGWSREEAVTYALDERAQMKRAVPTA